jgi:glycosyltransferase involved in cell wall biosynthesis
MVDREDVKQIHNVLDQFLQKQKLKQLKTSAREAAEQFSWEKAVKAYLEI